MAEQGVPGALAQGQFSLEWAVWSTEICFTAISKTRGISCSAIPVLPLGKCFPVFFDTFLFHIETGEFSPAVVAGLTF